MDSFTARKTSILAALGNRFFMIGLSCTLLFCGAKALTATPEVGEDFAATANDLELATCKKKLPINTTEIQAWILRQNQKSPHVESKITGSYNFKNESVFLLNLFDLLHPAPIIFTNTGWGTQRFVKVSACTSVICAVSEQFGSLDAGLRALYLLGEFGFNVAFAPYKNARSFTLSELNILTMSLSDVPVFLRKKVPLQPASIVEANGTYANSHSQVFKPWSLAPDWLKNYIVYHEFSHTIAEAMGKIDQTESWLKLSGWQQGAKACLSSFACSNATEYFAEAFSSFRYSPQRFQKTDPTLYDYIGSLYKKMGPNSKSISYLEEAGCRDNHPEFVSEKVTFQLLVASLEPELKAAFTQIGPAIIENLKNLCTQSPKNDDFFRFADARKQELLNEDCMNQELLKMVKITHPNYTAAELAMGLKPLERLKKIAHGL